MIAGFKPSTSEHFVHESAYVDEGVADPAKVHKERPHS